MPPLELYGSYQLVEKLAVGGMAQLFLARRVKPKGQERTVVLKRILPHLAEDTAFVTMFLDEARIAARLHHPNVIEILDLGAEGDSYFIAMEYIHGEDLRRIGKRGIEQGRRMAPALVCRAIAQACRGLDYAHRRTDQVGKPLRIVHRDVSPQNILVGFDGLVKVVDFGIAKAVDKATVTASGVIKGKHAYMSPEQALGREIDHRTDVFALGVVLYEILTATRLFRRATDLQTLKAVSECKVDPPSRVFPGVPAGLDPIILKALAKDLNVRYQYADALADDLERWLGDRTEGSVEALGQYVRELFSDRLERERAEGRFVPSKSLIEVGGTSRPAVGKNEPTASLRPVVKTVTDLNHATPAPAAGALEGRTTDVTPAFLPAERITEPVMTAGRRQTAEELPAVAEPEPEPVTISGLTRSPSAPPRPLPPGAVAGGTTPYGRPLSTQVYGQVNPLEQKTLIEPAAAFEHKTLIEPVERLAMPVASDGDPATLDMPEPVTQASGRMKPRPIDEAPAPPPKRPMWPWWVAAGLTTFAVAAVVTKVVVDRGVLLGPTAAPAPGGPSPGASAPDAAAGERVSDEAAEKREGRAAEEGGKAQEPGAQPAPTPAPGPSADQAAEPADAAVGSGKTPAPGEGAALPARPMMKPFNLVPVTGATFALVRRGGQLYASFSGVELAVGTPLRVVGPPRGGSKERDFYGIASVIETVGGEARILFDEPEALPDGLFVTPEEEKGPYGKTPTGQHGLTLVGSLQQRAGEPGADVALKNASDFDWSHCEVRLPDNRALRLGGSVVVRAGATQWISGAAFKPRSGHGDPKQREGFAYVRCTEGDGYLKVAQLP